MAFIKRNYTDNVTVITAENLNDIQDEIIRIGSFDPTAYDLPILALTGDTTGMTKDNEVSLGYVYGDRSGTCTMKWQGSSSISWPKKNYTIKFDNAFEASEGWGEQKKYCLKANFIDHSHARNVVSAKLWGQIVKLRSGVTAYNFATKEYVDDAYTFEDGVLTTRSVYNAGVLYLKDLSVPESGYTLTCEAFFPEGATDLKACVRAYRVDTDAQTGFITVQATSAGVWTPLEFKTIWAAGSSTLIALQGDATEGVKFRNIRVSDQSSSAVYTFEPSGTELLNLPNGGAIDGFPVVLTLNGEFHGLYTFNIPKDGWMFGMGDGTHEAIVCADNPAGDPCGFKSATATFDDFSLEYAPDEDNADWILTSLNQCISAVMNSDGTDLSTTVAQYLDWQSAIDYYIFTVLLKGTDMIRKNYILATYDGVKWFFSAYDMDTVYGLEWTGKDFTTALGYPHIGDYNHRVMELINTYKKDELKARYTEIRNTIMNEDNFALAFENFTSAIPTVVFNEDVRKWTTIPSSAVNNVAQIRDWYRRRVAVIDKEVEAL